MMCEIDICRAIEAEYGPIYKMTNEEYEDNRNAVVEKLKATYPCYIAKYWHSNGHVDMIGYHGIPKETAEIWAKKLGWHHPSRVLRAYTIKEVSSLNEGMSPSEHAYHHKEAVVRFADAKAEEAFLIDASYFTKGV